MRLVFDEETANSAGVLPPFALGAALVVPPHGDEFELAGDERENGGGKTADDEQSGKLGQADEEAQGEHAGCGRQRRRRGRGKGVGGRVGRQRGRGNGGQGGVRGWEKESEGRNEEG